MKRVCVRSFGRRSLPVIAIGVVLCALSATTSGSLLASAFVGMATTYVGLAYHHERRHRERLREMGETSVRT